MSALGPEVVLGCVVGFLLTGLLRGDARREARAWAVIALSFLVLAWWQPYGLVVTLCLTMATWLLLPGASAKAPSTASGVPGGIASAPASVARGVALLVAALVIFKYTPWLLGQLGISSAGGILQRWVVPFGISFTVFRLIGALMDARALRLQPSLRDLLELALFFPTYRSGPIESLRSLRELQGDEVRERDWRYGLRRMFVGLCRKVILADVLFSTVIAPWQETGIAELAPWQCATLPFLYGLYVYWDFSGYTDMAIGSAALLGYRVSENFNSPYLARNMSEFWRRWHITLSEWIRLRLFMKMMTRRSPQWHFYPATLIAMGLCGIWHGAGWNFLVWGLWHGVGLIGVQLFAEAQRRVAPLARLASAPGADAAAVFLTFLWVSAGWAFFFLPLSDAWLLLVRGVQAAPARSVGVLVVVAVGLWLYDRLRRDPRLPALWAGLSPPARGLAYAALIFGLILGSAEPADNFIYFAF